MNYNELFEELNELQNEEFNTIFIDKIMTIISKMRSIYYNDFLSKKNYNRALYDKMCLLINDILKNKLKELDDSLTNSNINDIISGIIGNHLFVQDIIKIEDYVFIEGTSSFNFDGKTKLLSVNNNLKDINSNEFSNCRENNYINSLIAKNLINKLVEIINLYFKTYFKIDEDVLSNNNGLITYNTPLFTIKLNKSLNDICDGIINNDVYNIEIAAINNGEVHLFDLGLGNDFYNIKEVNANIWKLSEINNKKKNK